MTDLKSVLREHWITGVNCDKANGTNYSTCSCSAWRGRTWTSVRAAVDEWIDHVSLHLHDVAQAVGMRASLVELPEYLDYLEQSLIDLDIDLKLPENMQSPSVWADRVRDFIAAQPPAAPAWSAARRDDGVYLEPAATVETEEWEEVTDGTTKEGDRFSYIPNPETGVGQITSHKRRVQRCSAANVDAEKAEVAERFRLFGEKGFRPEVFGIDDRVPGPMVTRRDCELIAAALTSAAPQEVQVSAATEQCNHCVSQAACRENGCLPPRRASAGNADVRDGIAAIVSDHTMVNDDGFVKNPDHVAGLILEHFPLLLAPHAGAASHDARNWAEDAQHENGNYECRCVECEQSFIGHKRRVICKSCSNLLSPNETQEAQDIELAEIETWIESIGRITPTIRQNILDAATRYEKCRNDRPLIFTMRNDDPLTVGDLRAVASALTRPDLGSTD